MIALDSSFLIAIHNDRDAHHAQALALMDRFLTGNWGKGLLRLSFVDTALAVVALSRSNGLILTFDEEFRKVAGLHVNPGA